MSIEDQASIMRWRPPRGNLIGYEAITEPRPNSGGWYASALYDAVFGDVVGLMDRDYPCPECGKGRWEWGRACWECGRQPNPIELEMMHERFAPKDWLAGKTSAYRRPRPSHISDRDLRSWKLPGEELSAPRHVFVYANGRRESVLGLPHPLPERWGRSEFAPTYIRLRMFLRVDTIDAEGRRCVEYHEVPGEEQQIPMKHRARE